MISIRMLGCWAVLMVAPLSQSAELAISQQTMIAGSEGVLRVTLGTRGTPVASLQFGVEYDPSILDVSLVATPALALASKELTSVAPSPGTLRALIFGLNNTPIPDGHLVELRVRVRTGSAAAEAPIRLTEVLGADAEGSELSLNARPGSVLISSTSVRIDAVRNAASFLEGSVAPGEIVSLMGTGFDSQDTVSVNGLPAHILHVSAAQINVVLPFAIAANEVAGIQVTGTGKRARIDVPVATAHPAIFTRSSNGTGLGAILNEDMGINSPENPAAPGSIVALFMTGVGQTDPPSVDGVASAATGAVILPVRGEIGGANADVLYAGPAPGLVSGMAQVNLRIPQGLSGSQEVRVLVGQASSQPGVTIAVR